MKQFTFSFPPQFLFALHLAWLDLIKVNPTQDVNFVAWLSDLRALKCYFKGAGRLNSPVDVSIAFC